MNKNILSAIHLALEAAAESEMAPELLDAALRELIGEANRIDPSQVRSLVLSAPPSTSAEAGETVPVKILPDSTTAENPPVSPTAPQPAAVTNATSSALSTQASPSPEKPAPVQPTENPA